MLIQKAYHLIVAAEATDSRLGFSLSKHSILTLIICFQNEDTKWFSSNFPFSNFEKNCKLSDKDSLDIFSISFDDDFINKNGY